MAMKMGRPPKPKSQRRDKPLRILLSESERRAIDDFAKAESLDSSTWARAALLRLVGSKK
jgi:hypothetical protein